MFLERYEEALQAFEQVLAFDSANPHMQMRKGEVLTFLHCYDEAIQTYEQLLPFSEATAIYNALGHIYSLMSRYDDALAHYDKAIASDTNNAQSYWAKGMLLWQLHRYDEVMQACSAAVERAPEYQERLRFLTISETPEIP
jgi:tetratricopeptide (TPR) repeat protein